MKFTYKATQVHLLEGADLTRFIGEYFQTFGKLSSHIKCSRKE